MPEGFTEARAAGRNCCAFSYNNTPGYWVGEGAVCQEIISLHSAAAWQNADGSVDLYVICRNGTDTAGAESRYWTSMTDSGSDVILKAWGNLDPGTVSVEPGGVRGYVLHFDADEVFGGTEPWSADGVSHYTSGYNSYFDR